MTDSAGDLTELNCAVHQSRRQAGAVADRAHSVLLEYQAHARRLDLRADVRAHNAGATGAVEARLESFGVVRPLVFGQYGEASL